MGKKKDKKRERDAQDEKDRKKDRDTNAMLNIGSTAANSD